MQLFSSNSSTYSEICFLRQFVKPRQTYLCIYQCWWSEECCDCPPTSFCSPHSQSSLCRGPLVITILNTIIHFHALGLLHTPSPRVPQPQPMLAMEASPNPLICFLIKSRAVMLGLTQTSSGSLASSPPWKESMTPLQSPRRIISTTASLLALSSR